MYVDPAYIVEHGTPYIDDPELAPSRLWLLGTLVTAEGILGHEQRVRDLFAMAPGTTTEDERTFRSLEPFWLSVFGRHDEAAAAFERVLQYKEFAQDQGGYRLGMGFDSQAMPALLRTYRATGRGAEADALARTTLAKYRAAQPRKPDEEEYPFWVRDAALAANEGLKDEAVKYLRQAMKWYDTPVGFVPSLPWFRSLEGHAGYDALRGELAQRAAKFRAEMRKLDASVPLPPAAQSRAAPSRP
jgi:tetratricopeptide (TPR) repeat protein